MSNNTKHKILNIIIAAIWLINGLFCKLLSFVPRHQQIIAKILVSCNVEIYSMLIGISEVIMALWIVTQFKSRLNAIIQIIVILMMNILEFILVPDLLLWGRLNLLFALVLVSLIYYNEFILLAKINSDKRK